VTFAADTDVPVERTRGEIERTLLKYGADQFAYGISGTMASIQFRAKGRVIRFTLPLSYVSEKKLSDKQYQQFLRTRWRCLLLSIKAKLETAESGISTFETEFMAHIVLPNGRTVGEHALPGIAESYKKGTVPAMLGFGT
jgi:hypothetical protein